MNRNHFDRWMGLVALVAFVLALAWASHASEWTPRHALAVAGARDTPGALVFNLLAFIVPGAALLAAALWRRWHSRDASGMATGIALWLLAIAALAWFALGLSPIDAGDLAGEGGQHHAALWMLWLIAVSAATVALVIAAAPGQRGMMGVLAVLWFVAVFVLPVLLGGWAQALAALAWMAWPLTAPAHICIMTGSARP
ncbi:hypothetical protein [Solilutibacter silvestris]|uniref:hypothetical protein n=1 Tax=Solilutibacter silvestris TaxID=1645665 RepID=UPI003D32BBFE